MLNIAVLSVNHHLATVAIREKVADKLTNKLLHTTFENIKKSPKISLEQSQDSISVLKKPTNIHNS